MNDWADEDDDTDDHPSVDDDPEDDPRHLRGTSECDGLCDPMCDWCLVGHECPEACGGGDACPYNALSRRESEGR